MLIYICSVIMGKRGVFFLVLSKESYTVRDPYPESFSLAKSKTKVVKIWKPSRITYEWEESNQFYICQNHIKDSISIIDSNANDSCP